jgi:hypothetical protein
MIIKNKGIREKDYFIPPFELDSGEIVVLFLKNGDHYSETVSFLRNIFCGIIKIQNLSVYSEFTFVEDFGESKVRQFLYPTTVSEFLYKNANFENYYSKKIYQEAWIQETTRINTLAGTPRKLLSLYSVLSKKSNIILDISGLDPNGVDLIFREIKDSVSNGGAAIILDSFSNLKSKKTKFVELQWNT